MGDLIFITGGARSGKSRLAEQIATRFGEPICYLATAEPFDEEMAERIRQHQLRRPTTWTTAEAFMDVPVAVERIDGVILLDCLSLWVSNLLLAALDGDVFTRTQAAIAMAEVADQIAQLLHVCENRRDTTVVVSSEVGSGIVPPSPLGRLYRDVLGSANASVAAAADTAYYCVAGRVIELSTILSVETDVNRAC